MSVRRHFNPRLLIRSDRVNVALAMQGIDVVLLEDYVQAEQILGIPHITVYQDYEGEPLLEQLQATVTDNQAFCQGITPEYVKHSFKKADMILYIKNQQYPYDILGFVTMSIVGRDLYVDLICTNQDYVGMGRYIVDRILLRLVDVLGLRQITLCSTMGAYPFYQRVGFEEVKNEYYCAPPLRKMRLKRTKTAKSKSTKSKTAKSKGFM